MNLLGWLIVREILQNFFLKNIKATQFEFSVTPKLLNDLEMNRFNATRSNRNALPITIKSDAPIAAAQKIPPMLIT